MFFIDVVERRQQLLAARLHVFHERRRLQFFEHNARNGAGERIAAERRAMAAELEGFRRFIADEQRANRHTAAQRFGERYRVRLHTLFGKMREHMAGAAHTALHLVEHEQRADFVAQLAQMF